MLGAGEDGMRKNLEIVALVVFGISLWITYGAFYGPHRLPERIATHFGADGRPNGWGSPTMLLMLPVIVLAVYGLMTLVAQFPSTFNYPVRVTAENRARLEELSLQMISWLKVEIVCLFTFIQWFIIQSARQGTLTMSPLVVPLCIATIFATVGWHIVAMIRTAAPRAVDRR